MFAKTRTTIATLLAAFIVAAAMASAAHAIPTKTGGEVPAVPRTTVVKEAKWSCLYRAPDGTCFKWLCVADGRSDCAAFKFLCERAGGHFSGSQNSGTCSTVL